MTAASSVERCPGCACTSAYIVSDKPLLQYQAYNTGLAVYEGDLRKILGLQVLPSLRSDID